MSTPSPPQKKFVYIADQISERRFLINMGATYCIFPHSLTAPATGQSLTGPRGKHYWLLGRTTNGNNIETKQNNISIIGVFSVLKRNEPDYSRTLKDRSKANIFMSILRRIEVNTNWVGPKLSRIEQKRCG